VTLRLQLSVRITGHRWSLILTSNDPDDHDPECDSNDRSAEARLVPIRERKWIGGERPSQASYS